MIITRHHENCMSYGGMNCHCNQLDRERRKTTRSLIRLVSAPVGLFLYGGELCFKSQYCTPCRPGASQVDAYIVASGEYFWGGTSDPEKRGKLMVEPLSLEVAPNEQDILFQLKEACNGHPHTNWPWPHQLLHDAAMEIDAARKLVRIWKAVAQTEDARDLALIHHVREQYRQDAMAAAKANAADMLDAFKW